MPLVRGLRSSCIAVLAAVLGLTGCTGHTAKPQATPAPATTSAAPGLFEGRLLAYATHGFSTAELAKITAAVAGPVTAVWSSERTLRSALPAFPLTPVATLLTDPVSYAAAVGQPDLAGELADGVVLATTEATLRGVTTGGSVTYSDGRSLPVTAVVADEVLGGYEMATSTTVLTVPSTQPAAYLLVAGAASPAALAAVIKTQLPTRTVRVEASTANGFLSSYDTVLTPLQIKARFGEFSLREGSQDSLVPDAGWTGTWIRTPKITQLGVVQCNKAILPDLTAAMREVTARGLGKLVHTADFQYEGGCWNPRITRFSDGGSISSHTWGIAIDINVDVNPLGAKPRQDPRLVAIMAEHGFAWGGRFLRPDGAHFEWVGTAMAEAAQAAAGQG